MVICLERGADLHTAQLMPLPLTVSCFSKIQIGFTFLVPAYPGSPGQRAVMPLNVRRVLSSRRSDAGYKLLHLVSLLYCGTCASGVVQGRRGSLGHRRVGVQPGSVLQQPRAAARCVRRVRASRTSVYSAVTRPRDVRRPADGHADSRYDDDSSMHRLLASNVCSCTHRNRLSGRGAHKELAQQ